MTDSTKGRCDEEDAYARGRLGVKKARLIWAVGRNRLMTMSYDAGRRKYGQGDEEECLDSGDVPLDEEYS